MGQRQPDIAGRLEMNNNFESFLFQDSIRKSIRLVKQLFGKRTLTNKIPLMSLLFKNRRVVKPYV